MAGPTVMDELTLSHKQRMAEIDQTRDRHIDAVLHSLGHAEPDTKLTGGRVNYYLVNVTHPQREEQPPYQAECEDIIEVLELNPDEANIFKQIWRGANARKANGKPGHTPLYGAEKIVQYAGRILRRLQRTYANEGPKPSSG